MSPFFDFLSFLVIAGCAGFCVSRRWWGFAVYDGLIALYVIAVIVAEKIA